VTYNKPSAIVLNAAEAIQRLHYKILHIIVDFNILIHTKQTSAAYEADE